MKILLIIIILTFNFQFLSKADDISEFEIEGISVGDSLLDHFKKQTINSARKYEYKNDKFYGLDIWSDKFKQYSAIQFHLKKNDNKYLVQGLSGTLIFGPMIDYYPSSKEECNNQKKIIVDSLNNIFPNADVNSYNRIDADDGYGGKAIRQETYFILDVGEIWVQCITYGKETKKKETLYDNLKLTLLTPEFIEWMAIAHQ